MICPFLLEQCPAEGKRRKSEDCRYFPEADSIDQFVVDLVHRQIALPNAFLLFCRIIYAIALHKY